MASTAMAESMGCGLTQEVQEVQEERDNTDEDDHGHADGDKAKDCGAP